VLTYWFRHLPILYTLSPLTLLLSEKSHWSLFSLVIRSLPPFAIVLRGLVGVHSSRYTTDAGWVQQAVSLVDVLTLQLFGAFGSTDTSLTS
jgi:hypothetical protein